MTKLKEMMKTGPLKWVARIFKVLFTIIIIAFILIVYLQRFSDNKISFFNYRMFTVVSSSMDPMYKIGDVLLAKKTGFEDIKVGDSISYMGEKGDVKNKIVTHQVIKIEKSEEGKFLFRTKGIGNLIEDPIVNENQVYGKVVYKTIILSTIYRIVSTNLGFYLCIVVPLIVIIGYEIFSTMMEKEDKKRKKIS